MKLIEAMKQIKELRRKADDLVEKIKKHSAHMNFETPVYEDQKKQVSEWLQSHGDLVKEIERLRLLVQRTNLATSVSIKLNGASVTKPIAAWIHRRKDLAALQQQAWQSLTDKGLREGIVQDSQNEKREVKIVRCYEPTQRDEKVALFQGEPSLIDQTLEVINATTEVVEA